MRIDKGHTEIWQEYQRGVSYHIEAGNARDFPMYERFKNGDQWPAATERTRNLPRPVFNICKFIIKNKVANVLAQNVKGVFTPEELPGTDDTDQTVVQAATDFTEYTAQVYDEIEQDVLNSKAIQDAATLGTCIWHYYWDNGPKGGNKYAYQGRIAGNVVDPLDVIVGNPHDYRVQTQPYIILIDNMPTEEVRELARASGVKERDAERIQPDKVREDTYRYDAEKVELDGADKTTVLTKYFKEGGFVWWTKITKSAVIVPPKQMPNRRYPLEAMVWDEKKKSFFGLGELVGLMPNQKSINLNIAMLMLSVQKTAWPKILAMVGALQQELTDEPGEIIYDYTGTGNGIKYMNPPIFSNAAIGLTDKIVEMTRSLSGTTESITGQAIGANTSAAAYIAMQNQERMPIDHIQKALFRAMKNIFLIWAEFYKGYIDQPRPMRVKEPDGTESTKAFNAAQYKDIEFMVRVDVGPAAASSEGLAVQTLDKFYDKGEIDMLMYAELAPHNVVPFKADLKRMVEQRVAAQQAAMAQQQDALRAQLPPGMAAAVDAMSPEEREALANDPELLQEMTAQGGAA